MVQSKEVDQKGEDRDGKIKRSPLSPKAPEGNTTKSKSGESQEQTKESWRWIDPCPQVSTPVAYLEQLVLPSREGKEMSPKGSASSSNNGEFSDTDKNSDEGGTSSIEVSPCKDEPNMGEGLPLEGRSSLGAGPSLEEGSLSSYGGAPNKEELSGEEVGSKKRKVHVGKVGKKILRRKIIQHRMKKLLEDEEDLPCENLLRKKKDSSRELVGEGDTSKLHCISETSEESSKEDDSSEEQAGENTKEGEASETDLKEEEENIQEDESSEEKSKETESAEKDSNEAKTSEENIQEDESSKEKSKETESAEKNIKDDDISEERSKEDQSSEKDSKGAETSEGNVQEDEYSDERPKEAESAGKNIKEDEISNER